MHLVYHLFLCIIYFGTLVYCQGARGGGRGFGGAFIGGSGVRGRNGESCKDVINIHFGITFLFGFFGTMLIFGCASLCASGESSSSLSESNGSFVYSIYQNIDRQAADHVNCFASGIWSSRYHQYGRWHGPHRFSLSFDSQAMTVTGSGFDDVGTFTIEGIYSLETNRMGLTKNYTPGTGDLSQNLGHKVTIQLTWSPNNNQFEGEWYVTISQCNINGKFILTYCSHV